MLAPSRLVRLALAFFLNVILACVATNILTSPFDHGQVLNISQMIWKTTWLDALAAFGLGYSVYRWWKTPSAKWVWVAGLCWFAQRAIRFWWRQRTFSVLGGGHSIYWEMSGFGCDFERESCRDWALYTLQLLRTVFYSVGALSCSYAGGRELGLLKSAMRGAKPETPTT
jgi:hypothetical protein